MADITLSRRTVLAGALAGTALAGCQFILPMSKPPRFFISLAQWSYHRALYAKEMDHLDFPRIAAERHGIHAVEYVNTFFKDKATDAAYLAEMNRRCRDLNVQQHLIMCDGEGDLGDPDDSARAKAVNNHHKWADAAKTLGCRSIRVNAASKGTPEEQARLAADGLRRLTEYCATLDLYCIVENHGGLSSHGDWLADVMRRVNHPRVGTLPDFGNFYEYDRYQGVTDMMPFARGVSAKSHDFDAVGNETKTDYRRMLTIVLDAGYRGHIGVEYEGERLPEAEGVQRTVDLLKKIRDA